MNLTPEAMRAARAILKWTMRDLATQSGVSLPTINAAENGRPPRATTQDALVAAFAARGVQILNGDSPGARMVPLERLEAHDMFEAVVDALGTSDPAPANALFVLQQCEDNARLAADYLPDRLRRAIKDLTDDDKGPDTYGEAAAIVRGLLPE